VTEGEMVTHFPDIIFIIVSVGKYEEWHEGVFIIVLIFRHMSKILDLLNPSNITTKVVQSVVFFVIFGEFSRAQYYVFYNLNVG
jgi:hypothetical protein